MKYIPIVVVLFFVMGYQTLLAAYITEPKDTFDVPTIQNIHGETVYGRLNGFPHTFTFTLNEETPFSMQVFMNAKEKKRDVSLILIREEKRGVSEVGRVTGKSAQWTEKYDIWRAMTFAGSPKQSYTLESGTYRLEVSSPENNKSYRLVIGKGKSSLPREVFTVRSVFKVSAWSVFLSPFVLGFLLGVFGIVYYRKKKKYVA